jgi:hypothetical protein
VKPNLNAQRSYVAQAYAHMLSAAWSAMANPLKALRDHENCTWEEWKRRKTEKDT